VISNFRKSPVSCRTLKPSAARSGICLLQGLGPPLHLEDRGGERLCNVPPSCSLASTKHPTSYAPDYHKGLPGSRRWDVFVDIRISDGPGEPTLLKNGPSARLRASINNLCTWSPVARDRRPLASYFYDPPFQHDVETLSVYTVHR